MFSNVKLLPGTGAACVQVYAKKGRVALRNLRYEDVTLDSGLKTELILPGADAAAPDCAGAELGVAGDSAEFFFNDKKVGEYRNLTPSSGRIQLQSEGFGIEYRNIVMYPTKRR